MGGYSSLGVGEEAPISFSDERQELVDFNAGVDREGLAFESVETDLLSLQNRGKHHSQETALFPLSHNDSAGFKPKVIEGLCPKNMEKGLGAKSRASSAHSVANCLLT